MVKEMAMFVSKLTMWEHLLQISGDRVAADNIPGEDVEGVDLLWFVGDDVGGATLDAKDLIVGASVG
jgi:hypothetical protein